MNANVAIKPDFPFLPMNTRGKLDTGKECNYNCYFCYYQGHLDEQDSYDDIIERAEKLSKLGITEVDLSGGESSIHPDWFKILDYCKEHFTSVSCLSNGSMFSDFEFLKKSKEHGLSEILFSVHGVEEHDKIVQVPGAWKNIIKAIKNAKKLNMIVRINCTVTEKNAKDLVHYGYIINKLHPLQINFLPLNYWSSADKMKKQDYYLLTDKIKETIDVINNDIEINVRYIPFCFMKGYEKYVVNTHQHIYDLRDWNICAYDYTPLSKYKEKAKSKIINSYYKPGICVRCKYFHICDGIEHKYKDIASSILKPEFSKKIKNIMEYR